MKLIGIYKITSPSGRVYIGQSIDIKRRFRQYKNLKTNEQIKLHNSFLKYGVDAHKFEIIELCLPKYLNNMERYYQNKYDSVNSGLNLMYVKSEHFSGGHSEESKNKISQSLKGKPIHQNTINALIQYNKTRVLSAESRQKMSNSLKGKKHSEETLKKLSEIRKGTKRSEETKAKMSQSNKNKRAVIQYDLDNKVVKIYNSIMDANKEMGYGILATGIYQCCRGAIKTYKGFKWKYK